ncbi:MAG: glycosyl transferase family protein [Candidatus Hecatellales archaeon B24]|nr:MAG: glycosyl transferase family protein [Candidatus Hecatellales archaeon B24]
MLLAAAFFAWNFSVVSGGLLDQSMGYVSDDIWYVCSARNMLREFWGLQPRAFEDGKTCATVLAYGEENYDEALEVLEQSGASYRILKDDYEKFLKFGWEKAFAVLASEETLKEIEKVEEVRVYRGYPYPDYAGIVEYMNFEHPPLVKYVLGLTMLVNDSPLTWRIPSLILGSAILVLAYLTARRIFGEMAGIAAAVFVFTERTVRAMSMVAMLDIYLSFFTILALYFALSRKDLLASALSIGLAGSAKMPGLFLIPGFIVSSSRKHSLKKALPVAVLVPALVYLALSTPVITYLGGVEGWVREVLGALKWHMTPRSGGPPTTDPLGLLLGFNAFPLSFTPPVTASPNFLLNPLVIPLTFIFAPLAVRGVLKGAGTALAWFWSAYLGYVAVYLAGNTTLYSFYAVQFTPIAAVIGGGIIHLINNPEKIVEALKIYREAFTGGAATLGAE